MDAKKENITSDSETKVAEFMPQSNRYSLKHKKFVVVLALVIIMLMVGGLGYKIYKRGFSPTQSSSNSASITPTQKAQYLADQGKYVAAEKVWQEQLANAKDQQTKLGIYYQQASLASRFKHYDDAKKYAEEAKQLAPNSSTSYVALAHMAESQGDKVAAKQYWQQAINHLDPNALGYNLILRDYQSSLDSLK